MSKSSIRTFINESRDWYICNFCHKLIPPWSSYVHYRGKPEGQSSFLTDRRHLTCTPEFLSSVKCQECGGGIGLPEEEGYLHCTC